ncbi:hypothetical protein E0Z10_g7154 [Xylaria hypoxylon]|uniref:Uncharacterized protein n=1 Tax=Xylaria hypoxylon TaxID=37992 RepID=A0A4Z0YVW9_9PEZI|nr:hypothetical protein E0Z10_g7154 [Xylaria hypoxylon]
MYPPSFHNPNSDIHHQSYELSIQVSIMKYPLAVAVSLLMAVLGTLVESSNIVVARSDVNAANNTLIADLEKREICYYTGFSDYACGGAMGDIIGYDQRCIYARGSRSFYTSSACPTMAVGLYEHKNCENGHNFYVTSPPGTCHDVNTGYAWLSSSWTAIP